MISKGGAGKEEKNFLEKDSFITFKKVGSTVKGDPIGEERRQIR